MERSRVVVGAALGCLAAALICVAPSVSAHPHMWIDAKATFEFDKEGRVSAVRQHWLFDDLFSPYAMQGVAKGKSGRYPAAVLDSMARDWMASLGEPISHYFTRVEVDGESQEYAEPRNVSVAWDDKQKRLALRFTLPLDKPVMLRRGQTLRADIYDPTYFVAYAFKPTDIALEGAPTNCKSRYTPPKELDYQTMQQLAAIPADPDPGALSDELFAITKGLTHRIDVQCH